jgi:hypothetical protein
MPFRTVVLLEAIVEEYYVVIINISYYFETLGPSENKRTSLADVQAVDEILVKFSLKTHVT